MEKGETGCVWCVCVQGIDEGDGHAVPFVLSQTSQEQKLIRNVPFLPSVLDQG